jgi:hypothetical protein
MNPVLSIDMERIAGAARRLPSLMRSDTAASR